MKFKVTKEELGKLLPNSVPIIDDTITLEGEPVEEVRCRGCQHCLMSIENTGEDCVKARDCECHFRHVRGECNRKDLHPKIIEEIDSDKLIGGMNQVGESVISTVTRLVIIIIHKLNELIRDRNKRE